MNYVVPGTGPSVVMARHLLPSGMPMQAPESLMHELNACGVRRLVVGHTPHGSCASVIKSGGLEGERSACLEVIMGDTSYSDASKEDMRGAAVSEIIIYPDATVRVLGVLPDLRPFAYTLGSGIGKPEELVGHMETEEAAAKAPDGSGRPRFVKAILRSGRYLMCRVSDGYTYAYSECDAAEAARVVGMSARQAALEAALDAQAKAALSDASSRK